jgi:hypothetical protein
MKSFQTMISKHLYPSKKRGRPKKNANWLCHKQS